MIRKTSFYTKDALSGLLPTSNMTWMEIQKNTFTNWVNEQLKPRGEFIRDIRTEIPEYLPILVEVLQRKPLTGVRSASDKRHARLQNITVALEAISDDGVRIVNIDSSDVADGNLKLILALIWQMILRYQIGFSNIQDKTWLLAWFQAVLPHCKVNNLTTDWNDGIALNALLEFCMPGLSPKWMFLDKNDKVNNCHYAMQQARNQFGIPLILRPEHLASTELDEMSSITYLSYFIKIGSPGYIATLQRIQPLVHNVPVFNFTTDWNDGRVLTELVQNLGANISDTSDRRISNIQRLQEGLDGGKKIGVEPLLTASDIAEEDEEHLGIMAYAAKFLYVKPESSTITSTATTNGVTTLYEEERRVTTKSVPNFSHSFSSVTKSNLNGDVNTYIDGSLSPPFSRGLGRFSRSLDHKLSRPLTVDTKSQFSSKRFSAENEPTLYSTNRYSTGNVSTSYSSNIFSTGNSSGYSTNRFSSENEPSLFTMNSNHDVTDDSFSFVRIPSLRKEKGKKYKSDTVETGSNSGVKVDTYSVGVIISTTSHDIISKDEVYVEAESPSGRVIKLSGDGSYNAQFTPDEIGEWKVSLFCHGKLVDSCPIDVCDPSQVKVTGLKGGLVNKKQHFTVDCRNAGNGDLEVHVTFRGTRVPCTIRETHDGLFDCSYLPMMCGVYHVSVNFNKSEIRDSDFLLGSDSDGMHRRAIFYTTVEPDRDKYNVKTSCDWQIDYITGGPFEVTITDKADIKVYSMQDGTVCNYPHLIADCSGLDPAPLKAEVTFKGQRFLANVVEDEPGIYRISFNPRGKGTYKIFIIFDGRIVKGSPFIQEIEEITPKCTGEGLRRGREGHECAFSIDARGFPGELTVTVDGPHFPIQCNVKTNDDGTHSATYVPEESGPHRLHIKIDGKDIDDSPYRPLIVDPSKIRVSGGWRPLLDEHDRIPLIVNKEKQIPFDASEAGLGELTAEVHGPSYKVPVAIDSRIGGKHTLIFTPREEGRHYIDVKWGGFPIASKPFLGFAVRLSQSEENIHPVISPVVLMQPKDNSPKDTTDFEKNSKRQNYHLIHPTYKEMEIHHQRVQGQSVPDKFEIHTEERVFSMDRPSETIDHVLHQEYIESDRSERPPDDGLFSMDKPNEIIDTVLQQEYIPDDVSQSQPSDMFTIHATFEPSDIQQSSTFKKQTEVKQPFPTYKTTDVPLHPTFSQTEVKQNPLYEETEIKPPAYKKTEVHLRTESNLYRKDPDDNNNKPTDSSVYYATVNKTKKTNGRQLETKTVSDRVENSINGDTTPTPSQIYSKPNSRSMYSQSTDHFISGFDDHTNHYASVSHSHERPERSGQMYYKSSKHKTYRMSEHGDGKYVSAMNKQPSKIYIAKRIRRRHRRSSGSSTSTSSSSDDDDERRGHSRTKVTLLRKVVDEPRVKLVQVARPEVQEVSVIRRAVAPEVNVVRAVVPQYVQTDVPVVRRVVQEAPVIRRVVPEEKRLLIQTVPTETISVARKVSQRSVRSPPRLIVPHSTASLPSSLTSVAGDSDRVMYRTPVVYSTYISNKSPRSSRSPSRTPSYRMTTEEHLTTRSEPETTKDVPKVILSGKGLKQAFVSKQATFNVDGREAGAGQPSARMFSTQHEIPIEMKPTGPKQFYCTYTPTHPGSYLLDIKWNDRQLKCCPFKISVNPPYYPEKVDVKGAHQKRIVVGKDFHLQVDPRLAGKGHLTAKCMGPSKQKVPVALIENVDGTTKLSLRPVETGRHILSIKYNKDHVLGSPYAIDVMVPQHSGEVQVHGPGIESNGVLGEYESHFWVDARGAGSGELNVSVVGPKGAFNVEMKRDSQKDKIFHCRYNPHEPGTYTINVKWSGRHVGSSPYRIHLGESRDDLERFLLELKRTEEAGDTILY